MSPISYVPRQMLGTWVVCCLVFLLTFIVQTLLTGCTDASTTGLFSLVVSFSLSIATHVVDKEFVASVGLLLVLDFCASPSRFHGAAFYLTIKRGSDKLIGLSLATFATTLTAIAEIRKTVDFTTSPFILILNSSSPIKSNPDLLEGGPFTSDESLSPPPSREQPHLHPIPTEKPSQLLAALPPRTATPLLRSNETSDLVPFGDDTSISNTKSITESTSSDPYPSVPGGNADNGCAETIVNSTLASPPVVSNQPGVSDGQPSAVCPSVSNSSADDDSTSKMRPDVFPGVVFDLPKLSRRITQNCLGLINVENAGAPIEAATGGDRRASLTFPRIIIDEELSSSPSSVFTSPSYAASTGSSSPHSASTAQTSPSSTQLDLQSDVGREAPQSLISTPSNADEFELLTTEGKDVKGVPIPDAEPEQTHVRDYQANRCAERPFPGLNITKRDYRQNRANGEAKLLDGERGIRSKFLPKAPPAALVGWAGEHDRFDEDGGSQAEVMQAILNYMRLPVTPAPLCEAPVVDKRLSSNLGRRPATRTRPTSPSVLSWRVSDDEVAIFGWGPLSTASNRRPLSSFAPMTPSSVKAETENKCGDEEGFERRGGPRTIAKSKPLASAHASTRPVSGASASCAQNQPSPQEDGGILEAYEALQPSSKEVVQPQSPALTRVNEEIAVSSWPSPLSPSALEPAPGKKKRVFRWKKFLKKLALRNPFKSRR